MDINYPVHQIRCPHCRKTLYLPIIEGYKQICCPACASVYSFKEYRFLDKSVEPQGEDTCLYRLRINSGEGIEAISFRCKDPKLSFFQQDQLLVLQTENSVAFLKNLTEGWSEYIHNSRTSQALGMGALSLLVGAMGYLVVSWWGFVLSPVVGGLLYWHSGQRKEQQHLAMADELQDAKAIQEHLSCVTQDNETLLEINEKLKDLSFSLERLQTVREEPSRFNHFDSDINTLDRMIAGLDDSLVKIRGYKSKLCRKLDRIWLDIELRNITAKIPDSVIKYQLQSQELEAQFQAELEAIAEIKLMLPEINLEDDRNENI